MNNQINRFCDDALGYALRADEYQYDELHRTYREAIDIELAELIASGTPLVKSDYCAIL